MLAFELSAPQHFLVLPHYSESKGFLDINTLENRMLMLDGMPAIRVKTELLESEQGTLPAHGGLMNGSSPKRSVYGSPAQLLQIQDRGFLDGANPSHSRTPFLLLPSTVPSMIVFSREFCLLMICPK
ncbi:Krueppel-like factor 12 [Varanus komodoensis]|nr:Krueppel-like factor 12 [Varanus komodoensis]